MVKAGILSMQRIANYGSFLQAYALKKLLEQYACSVEFVDYHVGEVLGQTHQQNSFARKVKKATEAFRIGAPFSETLKYVSYKKNFSAKYSSLLGLTEEPNYNPKLDLLVIGSDEVFNCLQKNPNVGFSPELFGCNSNAKVLISYAASFGNATARKLVYKGVFDKIRKWMKKFDALSLRDQNSLDVVREMGLDGEIHLDPVLTYDFKPEKENVLIPPREKYLIVYGYSGRFSDEECLAVEEYAEEHNLKIYNIGGIQKCCDRFIDCTPEEVIHHFMNADCVITDTFHGTILSVITERPFAVYVRKEGYGNSEKLTDLLKRLQLEDRSVENDFRLILEKDIDWNNVRSIIGEYRQSAEVYLKKHIKEAANA